MMLCNIRLKTAHTVYFIYRFTCFKGRHYRLTDWCHHFNRLLPDELDWGTGWVTMAAGSTTGLAITCVSFCCFKVVQLPSSWKTISLVSGDWRKISTKYLLRKKMLRIRLYDNFNILLRCYKIAISYLKIFFHVFFNEIMLITLF